MAEIHEGLTKKERHDLILENEKKVYVECSQCGLLVIGDDCYDVIDAHECSQSWHLYEP